MHLAFRDELCHECHLDAAEHVAKRDMFDNWHAWCKIADPAFALEVLRARIDRADTTPHANGFSDEDLRKDQFEAAAVALAEEIPSVHDERLAVLRILIHGDDEEFRPKALAEIDQILNNAEQSIQKEA